MYKSIFFKCQLLIIFVIIFNINLFGQKNYKNKIRISYEGFIMFNKLQINYGQDPLNYIIPSIQYQRQLDLDNKIGVTLIFSISQFHDYSKIVRFPKIESIGVIHYGIGFSYDNSIRKFNYHVSSGFLIRDGQEVSWVNDHPLYTPEPYYYWKYLISYGMFVQTSLEYKLSKTICALSILRYNLLAHHRNHTITFDLGISKKF